MFFANTIEQQTEIPQGNIPIRNFKPHSKFSEEEDERLKEVVSRVGEYDWNLVSKEMPGRNARQCKERWSYYLSPSLNTSPWTQEEDNLLLSKQRELGSKWVKISKFFHNRTDAMVKNRFQVLMRKMKKGILHLPNERIQTPNQVHDILPIVSAQHTDFQNRDNDRNLPSPVETSPYENVFGDFEVFFPNDEIVLDEFFDF